MVFSFGVNTLASDVSPLPHKKIKLAKKTSEVIPPPCSVTVSVIGTGTYECPGGGSAILYTAGASCTKASGQNCELAFVAANTCAQAKLAVNMAKERANAATKCPE